MEYIATFYTHSGAVKFSCFLEKENIHVELRPVPRQLTSNCGIAAQFSFSGDVSLYINEDIEKIFSITSKGYELIHENE